MTETNLCRLPDRGVIKLSGQDVVPFLQGLITNDVAKLETDGALYAALLTPQGKILFDFFVVNADDAVLLDCALDQVADLAKRLTFYRLRAAIEIEDVSSAYDVVASWGTDAAPALEGAVSFPDPRHAAMGFRTLAPKDAAAAFLSGTGTAVDEEAYHTHRISLGLADSIRDIGSGELFPHECNLDQLGAVDFKKGCYVGQEVVSRTEHRGNARKRILPVSTAGPTANSGDTITAASKPVGTILSNSGPSALALVRLDRASAALENGEGLEASGDAIQLLRPDWAEFAVPGT